MNPMVPRLSPSPNHPATITKRKKSGRICRGWYRGSVHRFDAPDNNSASRCDPGGNSSVLGRRTVAAWAVVPQKYVQKILR